MQEHQTDISIALDPVELLQCPEELHPDLRPHYRDGPIGKMLHHPLIVNVAMLPGRHKADNLMYLARKEEAERSWRDGDWRRYLSIHERPYRADALKRVLVEAGLPFENRTTWKLIKAVWIDSENVHEHDAFWTDTWKRAKLELTLDPREQAAFDQLPEIVQVWHGLERENSTALGLSWTTDRGVAEWFARRFARLNRRNTFLARGVVHKEAIKAFLLGRGEYEVIAFADNVDHIVTELL